MSTELEAKFAVDSLGRIRTRLGQCGAERLGRVLETNRIYDRPNGSLRAAGCGLRLREVETLDGTPRRPTLTFKGPIQAGPFKKREELELALTESQGMRQLLEAIGFVEMLRFHKRRESWRLERCCVELDELPRLGLFVEIEGPNEAAVQSVRAQLGLSQTPHIPRGYINLLAELTPSDACVPITFEFQD